MFQLLLLPALMLICFGSGLLSAQEAGQPIPKQATTPPAITPPQPTAIDQPAAPADGQLPPEAHPWGRFPVGSSKTVRVTSESLDSTGRVVNTAITETKTTLIQADDQDYQLRVESWVEVAGKRFPHPPQVTRHSYWGELAAPAPAGLRKVSTSEIELDGRKIACEIRQAVSDRNGVHRQTVVHYTPTQFPYLLKRESSLTTADAPAITTTVEVIATNMLHPVVGTKRPVAFVRTTYHGAKSVSVTHETQSADVPGGVVAHSALERDATGAIARRSSLELVEYHIGSETAEEAVSPGRRRWLRQQRRDMKDSRRDR
jgi:hypothetical protein